MAVERRTLVQAAVRARLLGLPLLSIDASVVVGPVPERASLPSSRHGRDGGRATGPRAADAAARPGSTLARALAVLDEVEARGTPRPA